MKYISYVRYALIAISLIIVAVGLSSGDVDAMINWGIFLLFLTGATLIGLSIWSSMKDPKAAGRSLVGFLAVLVVIGISYAMSDTTAIETAAQVFNDPADLIIADTGLFATYFVAILAILSIVGTEAWNLIKK